MQKQNFAHRNRENWKNLVKRVTTEKMNYTSGIILEDELEVEVMGDRK